MIFNRKTKSKHAAARIVFDSSDTTKDRFMALGDAKMLYEQGKLSALDMGNGFDGVHFGPPRSWRQMVHNEWPPVHPDVTACIAKYENATSRVRRTAKSKDAHA